MSHSSSLYIACLITSEIIAIVWLPMTEGSGAKFKENKGVGRKDVSIFNSLVF